MDALAATGEQVTAALTAIAIQAQGGAPAASSAISSRCSPTARSPRRASSRSTRGRVTRHARSGANIASSRGFRASTTEGNITTLGRGGSDTSAVAVAAALGADACEIYTDVDGVYTTDPNVCPSAKKIERISYEEMLELASLGAKVLQIRSVEVAMKYGVPVHVRSSFSDAPGDVGRGRGRGCLRERGGDGRRLRQG
jgi:aspartate kinase